ncbi:MAG: hypothetical protein WAM69_00880 [Candidatus Sulfotelmatobacter sp.]
MKMRDFTPTEAAELAAAVEEAAEFTKRRTVLRDRHTATIRIFTGALLLILALLAGCESNKEKPPETKPGPKPPELLTGRAAFQKLFIAARNYAADVKPFRIESTPASDGNGQGGKSAIWQASFASAMRRGVKPFVWSGSNSPDAPSRGISPGTEDVYNPNNASTQVFDVSFLKVDSDQAFAEAQKHGGDKLLEKDPATPVICVCEWSRSGNELVWYVIYGPSRATAKLTVVINATTGAFLRVEK